MPIPLAVPIAIAAGSALAGAAGSYFGNKSANDLMNKGTNATLKINEQTRQQLQQLYGDAAGKQGEYAGKLEDAGNYSPLDTSKYLAGAAALDPGKFSGNVDVAKDPGYQFRMDEAQKGLEAQQAKTGTLRSGFAAKDMAKYMQGVASQEYQNAYNRDLSTYNTQLGAQNQAFNQGLQHAGLDVNQQQFGANLNMNALQTLYGGANNNLNAYATALSGLGNNDMQTIMSKYSTQAQNAVGNNPLSILGGGGMNMATGLMGAK
jgi:hypothetical protein